MRRTGNATKSPGSFRFETLSDTHIKEDNLIGV